MAYRLSGLGLVRCNITIENSTFLNNYATLRGGGLGVENPDIDNLNFEINNCTFKGNYAARGSGIFLNALGDFNTFNIEDCTIDSNYTVEYPLDDLSQRGGGLTIFDWGNNNNILVKECEFTSNISGTGGGIDLNYSRHDSGGQTQIENCDFSNNTASCNYLITFCNFRQHFSLFLIAFHLRTH